MEDRGAANRRWSEMLSHWAIPEDLVATAPEPPYFFDPHVFIEAADEAIERDTDTPSDRVAREALPTGGTVLDVGAGAGAASLRLGAGRVVGVDPTRVLLNAFVERATRLGIEVTAVDGAWPDVAADTPPADVVVCHHVIYNVTDLAAFTAALTDHAKNRVVVELTATHPMTWMAPYWTALYGLQQPDRPTAGDAVAVLEELGLDVTQQRWSRRIQMIGEARDDLVARIGRRLCLAPERYDELREVLVHTPPPHERAAVTLWW